MKTVLLVDDNHNLVVSLTNHLETSGFKVHTADRMDEGLKILDAHPIDIVVTDFHIQQGSGRRLLNEIRKTRPALPVFLITGTPFVTEEDLAAYPFDKVFLKPFLAKDLIAAIREACAS